MWLVTGVLISLIYIYIYIYVKALPRVLYVKQSMRRMAEILIKHEAKLSALLAFFSRVLY